jgi:putative transposase
MDKFSGKYRIDSTRLQNWDYSWKGKYFITICTRGFDDCFGEILDGRIYLSKLGIETELQWRNTIALRPDMNLTLHDYQVMPNHFHGIIEIGRNIYNNYSPQNKTQIRPKNKFGPQSKNLASVIRGFKGSVTTYARINKILFDWQPRFHDHIIRNDVELIKIKTYIQNNVKNWNRDKFHRK